ncbi:protein HEXIM1-like isoform X1 [Varroa jacobsoni]|uniref:Uncharacterized protein n=1 Tax=Varroa destructor TaxID=109461 RepID=A0A7M7KSR0_VARDE|nr:protein HEXIM1-like isoform X1 [Varroa destructor]XP_022693333.1 protein HEXIM1-like isoform X1 [Varroa jacobsoni]
MEGDSPMQAESAPHDGLKMAVAVPEADVQSGSGVLIEHRESILNGKKKFFRRRKRVNFFKRSNSSASSWAERREEARRRRAAVRRQSLGQPVAPYNTTQFLMEEHKAELDEKQLTQPRQHRHHRRRGDSFNSMDSYGEDYQSSSYEDDEEYLQAQFSAEYDSVASERLHAMSKPELVHEYLLLEARIDELEEELKAVKKAEESDQPMEVQATEEDIAKITVFQQEISKLQAENRRLIQENDHLRQQTI